MIASGRLGEGMELLNVNFNPDRLQSTLKLRAALAGQAFDLRVLILETQMIWFL